MEYTHIRNIKYKRQKNDWFVYFQLKVGWNPFNLKDAEKEKKDKNHLNFYCWFDAEIAAEKTKPECFTIAGN